MTPTTVRTFVFLPGLFFLILAPPLRAHLDPGACLATTEMVLDYVTMISTDEAGEDGPGGTEEVRIYTNVSTQGHWKQESFFAFADDQYGGLTKDEYDKAIEDGEESPHGDQPIVGHTIYYHVNCLPHEPFNIDFEMWDDDSWDLDDILEFFQKILDLPGMPKEAKLWGGIGLAIGELASQLSKGSRDNHSKAEIRGKHYANGQHTEPGTMRCCNDQNWENGDHSADFVFTVTKTSQGACTLENWESALDDFIKQIEAEKVLKDKLRDAYENLLKDVRDREKAKEDTKSGKASKSETRNVLDSKNTLVAASRAQVQDVLVDAAQAWMDDDGTIPMSQYQTLEKLQYWADESAGIEGIPLVSTGEAASCDTDPVTEAPARTAQITFSSIEAGDRITFSPSYVQGRATISFTALEEGEKPVQTEVSEDEQNHPLVAFLGAVAAGTRFAVRGEHGGAVEVSTGPTDPVIVTGGRGSFRFDSEPVNPISDVGVLDTQAPGASADWVASRTGADGTVESVFDVAGLPLDVCQDGELAFEVASANGESGELTKACTAINYRMQQLTHVGQTVPLQATVHGLDDGTTLQFTIVPDPARVSLSSSTATLTVAEINSGAALTQVTSKSSGDHELGVTVKIIRD